MNRSRRDFLQGMSTAMGWSMLSGCATLHSCWDTIKNRPVRRNINSLAPNDPIIVAYKSAVTQMKALPMSDRRNWTNQARIHLDHCPHGNWLFLPWHRAYLFFFERICRKLSGMADFALPYWNWTADPTIPAVFWGGASNPLFDNRVAGPTSVASAFNVGPAVVNSILNETNFLLFASGQILATDDQRTPSVYGRLEATPHSYIHGFVGGHMGNFWSPLDPIFWQHHNMIERCWIEWNLVRNHPNTNDPAWVNRTFTEFCDENGDPATATVVQGLLYPFFAYQYDSTGVGTGPSGSFVSGKAEQEKAKSGATVRLEMVRRFPALEHVRMTSERVAPVKIAIEPGALRDVRAENGLRALLAFEGARLNYPEDFSVRVFINKPDASPVTPIDDAHLAGAFALFDHPQHSDHPAGAGFVLDATPVLKQLQIEGGDIEFDIVLVPHEERPRKSGDLTVQATELRIVRDIVERTNQ